MEMGLIPFCLKDWSFQVLLLLCFLCSVVFWKIKQTVGLFAFLLLICVIVVLIFVILILWSCVCQLSPAKAGSSAGCEGGAAETPGNLSNIPELNFCSQFERNINPKNSSMIMIMHQVVSSFEVMIWSISATTPSDLRISGCWQSGFPVNFNH